MSDSSGTLTIMFTDMVGSTALGHRLGDIEAKALRRAHDRILLGEFERFLAQLTQTTGDGYMVAFLTAREGVQCAIEIQRRIAQEHDQGHYLDMEVRIGLHTTEPTRDGDSLFGSGLSMAARVEAQAQAGQILVSEVTCLLARETFGRDDPAATFLPAGERELKGYDEPVPLYEVRWRAEHSLRPGLTRFIGRKEETARLREYFDSAIAGRGCLALVGGDAGVGKTRLVSELAVYAGDRGAIVLTGRSYDMEGAPSYLPFSDLLKEFVRGRDKEELSAMMNGYGPHLRRLVPELNAVLPGAAAELAAAPDTDRFQLFEAVSSFLLRAASSAPLMLVLDDLQWADDGSLLLLEHLSQRLPEAPLLVVGTYRQSEVTDTHLLARTQLQIARDRIGGTVVLQPFGREDAQALVQAVIGRPPAAHVSESLFAATQGNSFFIEELVRYLQEEGHDLTDPDAPVVDWAIPDRVRQVIGRRLARLSENANRLLVFASVLGRRLSLSRLSAITKSGEDATLQGAEEALEAQLLREADDGYVFSHPLLQETLYQGLSAGRRRLLHRQVGEGLEQLYAGRAEPVLAELAHHFFAALPDSDAQKASDYGRRAGDVAMQQFAYEDAAAHYDAALRALELKPQIAEADRYELLTTFGDALTKGGDVERGRENLLRAVEIARDLGDADRLAQTTLLFSGPVLEPGVIDSVRINLLEESIAALGNNNDLLRISLLARLANELRMSFLPGSKERGRSLAEQAMQEARLLGNTEALLEALDALFMNTLNASDLEENLAIAEEMVTLADGAGNPAMSYVAHTYRSMPLLEAGDLQAFELEYEILGRLAEELRQPRLRFDLLAVGSALAFFQGRFKEGRERLKRLLADGERALSPFTLRYYVAINTPCELDGDPEDMANIESALDALIKEGAGPAPFIRSRRAYFLSESGRESEARRQFEEMATAGFGDASEPNGVTTLAWAARTCSFLGDSERAGVLYEVLKPYATHNAHNGNEVSFGSVSRYLGLLATTMKRWPDAERHFEDALEMNARMRAKPWTAHTQHDYAKMLLARGGPGDQEKARRLLEEALATSQELGMEPTVERVRNLLPKIPLDG